MAKFFNPLHFGRGEAKEISAILARLDSQKTPVRVEVEEENTHFYSVISLKRELVVVAKPVGMKKGLKREGFVRFKVPGEERELRLEITVPHFNLLSGGYVFLCKIPSKYGAKSLRSTERYNTSRFNNLHLSVPLYKQKFRVIDISQEGCKVFLEHVDPRRLFAEGKEFSPASLSVGQKVEIGLDTVIPRSITKTTVGFQMKLGGNGHSRQYLSHFLQSLETAEISALRTEKF